MSIDKQQVGLLLSKIALRDQKAFEALYQLASVRLFAVIYSVVKDEQIAADLLQEGFVKLWYSDNRYPVDYPWAWLCQSMRNLAIDEVRKRGRRKEEPLETSYDDLGAGVGFDINHGLSRCLKQLNEDKRNAIVLAYQHGLSHQEIMRHMKAPLGTVKSQIRRGLQELKRCLVE